MSLQRSITFPNPRRTIGGASLLLATCLALACGPKTDQAPETTGAATTATPNAAPDSFRIAFETSKGRFVALARRAWAPKGADRLYELVNQGFYDEARFFRVLPGFVAQFGMHRDPKVSAEWENKVITDDPVTQSNRRGTITFATGGPNTRTTQLFVNLVDNPNLDQMGFAPVAEIVEGLAVVDSLYGGYGEGAPNGAGPSQGQIRAEGNEYLTKSFPKLDYIKTARIVAADGK